MNKRPSVTRRTAPRGGLLSFCSVCETTATAPDKGLGWAYLAAWESRHGVNCPSAANAGSGEEK